MVKKVSIICSLILVFAIGGYGIYEWLTKDVITASTIFFVFLGLAYFFQSITWGKMEGKYEAEKNEREKHITYKSSKISYFLLLAVMCIVLLGSERVFAMNDIQNIPLVLVIGFALITLPITEFVLSRKYRTQEKQGK
jgi:hypothetical protein